ncbi:hypothetical protein, partial [Paraburkholderia antibiotica]|uniref:hypothetical protein n=1 Tax=Paraburkholderia antibiotica TaxID=2728839 RepID=UPI00197FDA99
FGKRTFLRFEQNGDRGPGVFAATTTRAANCAMRRKRVVQTFLNGFSGDELKISHRSSHGQTL